MKSALVIHDDLNAVGGRERLAVITIEALNDLGFRVDLATVIKPDLEIIRNAFSSIEVTSSSGSLIVPW